MRREVWAQLTLVVGELVKVSARKAPLVHGRRGWDWRVEVDGRLVGSGWTAGTQRDAKAEADAWIEANGGKLGRATAQAVNRRKPSA